MREARTIDPKYPYLLNASSSPRFGVVIEMNCEEIEDGFLADFPKSCAFALMGPNAVKDLKRNMFAGARHLQIIQIARNPELIKIEEGIFEGMNRLMFIVLFGNPKFVEVTEYLFKGIPRLNSLYIQECGVIKIHKDAFKDLVTLSEIWFERNRLAHLNSDTFANNIFLNTISLVDNLITSLPSDLLRNLINLKIFDARLNPLENIPSGFFNYSTKPLMVMVGCCNNLYKKREPECQPGNDLNVGSESFITKTMSKAVSISGCLKDIPPLELKTEEFYINFNNVTDTVIKAEMFKNMRGLNILSLWSNDFAKISKDAFTHIRPFLINLSNNLLEHIPSGAFDGQSNLQELFLGNNRIQSIDALAFRDLASLTEIDLAYNQISHIENETFSRCINIKKLTFSNNKLMIINQASVSGLASLEELDLSFNQIEKIEIRGVKVWQPSLQNLFLQGNKISNFVADFTMENLDLSQNRIEIIQDSFRVTKSLNISYNNIQFIAALIEEGQATNELFLQHNHITNLDFIGEPMHIKTLDVSYNKIVDVNHAVFLKLTQIKNLQLAHNPWRCSCSSKFRPVTDFLLRKGVISCCPKACTCTTNAEFQTVVVDCHSRNQSALPPCLPYKQINADYSDNMLKNVMFTKGLRNITAINFQGNQISNIDGASLSSLKNLTVLNLENNHLSTIPQQLVKMRYTKVFLEGNQFSCQNCDLVSRLGTLVTNTPQNISCQDNVKFQKASMVCLLEYTVLPYSLLGLSLILITTLTYQLARIAYMKKLEKRYFHTSIALDTKESRKSFEQERSLLKQIAHVNIRQIHASLTTWVPSIKRVGHLYLEPVDFSILDTRSSGFPTDPPLQLVDVTHQLINAVHFLHSRDRPIHHGNLTISNVFLKLDNTDRKWIVKIGNFSQALVIVPSESTDEEGLLIPSTETHDLQNIAKIVLFLTSGNVKSEEVGFEDVCDLEDINIGTLIMALEGGMSAADALLAPAFHSSDQKMSLLSELNASFKMQKKGKKVEDAEKNAALVIGGAGAWNRKIDETVMEEFGTGMNNHDITSFVDLLRFVRNILQHGHENTTSMVAMCGEVKPSPEKILEYFMTRFPFFYPHSCLCFYQDEDQPEEMSKLYLSTVQEFEAFSNDYEKPNHLVPNGTVTVTCTSLDTTANWTIPLKHKKSSVELSHVVEEVTQQLADLEEDILPKDLVVKRKGKIMQNTFSGASSKKTREYFSENSTIDLFKPEMAVAFPCMGDQQIRWKFASHFTVKAAFGLVKKMQKGVSAKDVEVFFEERKLDDDQAIADLDFLKHPLVVRWK